MQKSFGVKPYTYPQPVFIIAAYGEDGTGGGLCRSVKLRRIPMPEGVDSRVHRGLRP